MKSDTRKKLTIIVCTVLFGAAMLLIYFVAVVPPRTPGEKTVTLEFKYKNAVYTYAGLITEKETVFELLKEYDEELSLKFEYTSDPVTGAFVTSFKDTANDDESWYYYMFKINGVYSDFGVSSTAIKDGDSIVFEYGSANYDANWAITSVTLQDNSSADASNETLIHKRKMKPGRIAAAVCGSVAAAGVLGIVIFTLLHKNKETREEKK